MICSTGPAISIKSEPLRISEPTLGPVAVMVWFGPVVGGGRAVGDGQAERIAVGVEGADRDDVDMAFPRCRTRLMRKLTFSTVPE